MTAIRGTFSDFKVIKTRSVCQIIIEVPIENADHALSVLGGVPQMKAEQWVGVAPVTAPDAPAKPAEQPAEPVKGGARARRDWEDVPMPQQAGMLVNEPESARFIALYLGIERPPTSQAFNPVTATDDDWRREADIALKRACQIESKSELGVNSDGVAINPNARAQFITIERAWRDHGRGWSEEAYQEMAR